MDASGLIKTFFETFDGSAKAALSDFVTRRPRPGAWIIAADYVVQDKTRPNDVFAFSILPYDEALPALRDRLRASLPRDIKNTRRFVPSAAALLRGGDVFHIPVILPKSRKLLGTTGAECVLNGRRTAEELLRSAIDMERGRTTIAALRKVRDATRHATYSHSLLADVLLLGLLFPAVTIALMRETDVRDIAWMSDRDRMTNWCGGALWSIAQLNLAGMAESMRIDRGANGPGVCVPSADGKMWFDEVVRLPDHVAGALAAWDLNTDSPAHGSRAEFVADMLREIFADAENIAVLKLRSDADGTGWSRVVFSRA